MGPFLNVIVMSSDENLQEIQLLGANCDQEISVGINKSQKTVIESSASTMNENSALSTHIPLKYNVYMVLRSQPGQLGGYNCRGPGCLARVGVASLP